MIKQKIKKHIKKIIIAVLIIFISLFVRYLYDTFVSPFIQPYFYKTKNIEILIGTKLPKSAGIIEYEVDAEPTYSIGKINGIRGIYAKIGIVKDTYESLKEQWKFDDDKYAHYMKNFKDSKNYESFNIENVEEINFRYNSTTLLVHFECYGIWKIYNYHQTIIGIVLIKEKDERYYLYVFS